MKSYLDIDIESPGAPPQIEGSTPIPGKLRVEAHEFRDGKFKFLYCWDLLFGREEYISILYVAMITLFQDKHIDKFTLGGKLQSLDDVNILTKDDICVEIFKDTIFRLSSVQALS